MEKLKDMISSGEADLNKQCEALKATATSSCSSIQYLVNTMNAMGCPVDQDFMSCFDCEDHQINGGFKLDDEGMPGVVVCQNHVKDQETMNRTLLHELIHAFDHCRAKVNWKNCEQHACSEVRAAALSGDCHWKYEIARGNMNFRKQHQMCVKRRAKLSVAYNDACQGKDDECIERIFERCYRDISPFLETPEFT